MVDDDALARACARAAGDELVSLRAGGAAGSTGDARANRAVLDILARERPDDAVLSEESVDDPRRLSAERVWIVDPLDGTREFGEPGRGDWAVHVALWRAGELVAGAVALPATDVIMATDAPPVLPAAADRGPRIAVSRSRPAAFLPDVARSVGGRLVPLGSAGYKAAAVISGEVDAYLHAGGQYEWDSAAPVAVATAVGLHCSRIDGSPLRYNQPDPFLPDLVICRPELADVLLRALAESAGAPVAAPVGAAR